MDRNRLMLSVRLLMYFVALRKESVDRNYSARSKKIGCLLSLSARRAWIEIDVTAKTGLFTSVALRKESVDRNTMRRDFKSLGLGRSPQGERG